MIFVEVSRGLCRVGHFFLSSLSFVVEEERERGKRMGEEGAVGWELGLVR